MNIKAESKSLINEYGKYQAIDEIMYRIALLSIGLRRSGTTLKSLILIERYCDLLTEIRTYKK